MTGGRRFNVIRVCAWHFNVRRKNTHWGKWQSPTGENDRGKCHAQTRLMSCANSYFSCAHYSLTFLSQCAHYSVSLVDKIDVFCAYHHVDMHISSWVRLTHSIWEACVSFVQFVPFITSEVHKFRSVSLNISTNASFTIGGKIQHISADWFVPLIWLYHWFGGYCVTLIENILQISITIKKFRVRPWYLGLFYDTGVFSLYKAPSLALVLSFEWCHSTNEVTRRMSCNSF